MAEGRAYPGQEEVMSGKNKPEACFGAGSFACGGLTERLERYRDSGYYPFHMPGHKRNMPQEAGDVLRAAAGLDIKKKKKI